MFDHQCKLRVLYYHYFLWNEFDKTFNFIHWAHLEEQMDAVYKLKEHYSVINVIINL